MSLLADCAGAPRDLGLDQGRACRAELGERFAALPWAEALALRLGRGDASLRRLQRGLARHLPHLSEALAGLAVGARVPEPFLARELVAELASGSAPAAALAGGGGLLVRSQTGLRVVRRNRPEGLFASLDVTRPWLPSALLGVNERGFAVAVAASGPADSSCAVPASGPADSSCAVPASGPADSSCAVPGALLAQDCLERFEALDAALDWCAGRPACGRATILFADPAGEIAGIEIDGALRRVLRPADDRLAGDEAGAELAKSLRDAPELPRACARVETRERSLTLDGATFRL